MDNIRDIVNGSLLPRFVNKPVSIIGNVRDVDPNGMFFNITTTDENVVKINVRQPIDSPVTGWVEARGICTGRAVNAESFIIFSNEKFHSKAYNDLCSFLYSVPEIWKTS